MKTPGPDLVCDRAADLVCCRGGCLAGCRICFQICSLIWPDRHQGGGFRGLLSDVYFYRLVLVST